MRIASLLASSTEILYGLGLGDQVVAISHECDFPPEAIIKPRITRSNIDPAASSAAIDEQVRADMSAGMPLYELDVEQLASLSPDLIVTQAQCDVCAIRYEDVVTAVNRHPSLEGAHVVALNPKRLADIFEDIRRVGQASGSEDVAERWIESLMNRVNSIGKVTRSLSPSERPKTLCVEWVEPLMAAANWTPELVDLAGGQCELTKAGEHSTVTKWESIATFDPEVIVVMPCGFDLERSISEGALLAKNDGWENLAAVRNGRVFAVDGNAYFNRSGPRIVDSLEILAGLIHPERFKELAEVHRHAWRQI
jgi:iron complex transport system substrate-binding protein